MNKIFIFCGLIWGLTQVTHAEVSNNISGTVEFTSLDLDFDVGL